VDVVVTDGKSHFVKGLQQQNFKLTEDGTPQEVRYFDDASQAEQKEQVQERESKIPDNNEVSNRSGKGSTSVILFDMLNTPVAEQKRAWQQFINFVRNKPKDARFALCAIVPTSPHVKILEGFTDEQEKLLAAASGKKVSPHAAGWQLGEVSVDRSISTVSDLAQEGIMGGWDSLLQGLENMRAEQQVTDANLRSQITLDVFTRLGGYLSALRGRKNLIWLSGSFFPISLIADTNSSNPASDNPNYAARIKHTSNLLADGEVSVYPVDVRGMDSGSVQAKNMVAGIAPSGQGQAPPAGYFAQNGMDSMSPSETFQQQKLKEMSVRSAEIRAMNELATSTGGRAFYNPNGILPAITLAVEEGSITTRFPTIPIIETSTASSGRSRWRWAGRNITSPIVRDTSQWIQRRR
jgi:VWFA-related protein